MIMASATTARTGESRKRSASSQTPKVPVNCMMMLDCAPAKNPAMETKKSPMPIPKTKCRREYGKTETVPDHPRSAFARQFPPPLRR